MKILSLGSSKKFTFFRLKFSRLEIELTLGWTLEHTSQPRYNFQVIVLHPRYPSHSFRVLLDKVSVDAMNKIDI